MSDKHQHKPVSFARAALAAGAIVTILALPTLSLGALLEDTTTLTAESCGCANKNAAKSPACKQYCGQYEVNDVFELAIDVAQIILGLSGSLALLAFVYGGVLFIASAGNREQVEKGRRVIIGSVIGLVIVFASYTIVGFVFNALGLSGADWFTTTWFK